jgi:hypothetical protein
MLRRAGLMAVVPALLVPAVAGTTVAAAKTRAPVVKRVAPKKVFVGQTLTIHGRHFRRGINKNTVAFKRNGAKAVFVKAEKGTTKLLKVTLPKRLEKILVVKNGTPTPTRLAVRVLTSRFGKRFTSRSKSPIVGAEKPPAPPKPVTVDPNADCDGDGQINRIDADDDNDLLSDSYERSVSKLLDTCKADTDGDGVEDGYEYQSAKDLNDDEYEVPNNPTPYPRKLPYPNPLDGEDAGVDHDGDTLTLMDEYKLWKYTIAHGTARTLSLSYSAGKQYSLGKLPRANYIRQNQFINWAYTHHYGVVSLVNLDGLVALQAQPDWLSGAWTSYEIRDFDRTGGGLGGVDTDELYYYDYNGNTYLDDAERDEDGDGLSNYVETHGPLHPGFWTAWYPQETSFRIHYEGTEVDDPDTDGDGVLDGADDQDHDDYPNLVEVSRNAVTGRQLDPKDLTPATANPNPWYGRVQPFNPCMPWIGARTCPTYHAPNEYSPFTDNDINYGVYN